jgi:hypothetical protein
MLKESVLLPTLWPGWSLLQLIPLNEFGRSSKAVVALAAQHQQQQAIGMKRGRRKHKSRIKN